jgi:hypothetical protein
LFKPDVFKPGVAWEQEIVTIKQAISDERIANRSNDNKENNQEQSFNKGHVQNVVKVVDKTYLDKNFHKSEALELVDSTAKAYSLNEEQVSSCVFHIIANHAISNYPEQLRMCLGSMGSTLPSPTHSERI